MSRSRDRADAIVSEISREGVFAGRVFAATLIVSAVALIGLSWDDIWRVCNSVYGECVERSAGGMILTIGSIAAIVGAWGSSASGAGPSMRQGAPLRLGARCPVRTRGIFIAARIPAFTCDRGHFDDASRSACTHRRSRTP